MPDVSRRYALMIVLSLVVQVATLSVAQDVMPYVRFELPLRGTATESLDLAQEIVRVRVPETYERWKTPPCLQAFFKTTSLDYIVVLICEGMSWEEHISLGCTSLSQSAADAMCEAIRASYLLDI